MSASENRGAANGSSARCYKLYIKETDIDSMRALIFVLEAKLIDFFDIVKDITPELGAHMKQEAWHRVQELESAGKDCLPSLWIERSSKYVIGDDAIQDYLAKEHCVDLSRLPVLNIFDNNTMKDFSLMKSEIGRLASKREDVCMKRGLAWFRALDFNQDGNVTLEEMIQGLDITRFLAEARRGETINLDSSRWKVAVEQVDLLNTEHAHFINGWRLRMILGTICDSYDMVIQSADKILELAPGDVHALSLKVLYCRALGKKDYKETLHSLGESSPSVASAIESLVQGVDKYWEMPLRSCVPRDVMGDMSILALGSPANDDGTPRPRLLATLQKTLEAAECYPDAHIFVTGAAVSSNLPEAVAMKHWLCDRGVNHQRITMEMKARDTVGNYVEIVPMLRERGVHKVMLITVHYHLNRSSALADAVFESCKYDVQVVGVAGESDLNDDDLVKRMGVERLASYRDVARARALFELQHFKSLAEPSKAADSVMGSAEWRKRKFLEEPDVPSDPLLDKKFKSANA